MSEPDPPTVTLADLRDAPARVMALAKRGPVAVVDEHGARRFTLTIPSDDDKPAVWRGPNRTLMARAFGVSVGVKARTQRAIVRLLAAPLFKAIAAGVAVLVASIAAWRCGP